MPLQYPTIREVNGCVSFQIDRRAIERQQDDAWDCRQLKVEKVEVRLYFRLAMLLSVIIVNYNVKYFLEQCLCSVKKAIEHQSEDGMTVLAGQTEVWVVDNQSTDGSLEYLRPRFSWVNFIENRENTGFARANNQALSCCTGQYILYLNPDTIVPEDAFQKCLHFMDARPAAGALGVHMVDGSGHYLPESKRGFPSGWVSFCKMIGLTRLFPSSRLFARYYLGHLSTDEVQKIDVISGAYLWARKDVLQKTGGFDERFFMYAEDIDLSYRIQLAGYHNYYLPSPVIIHFKGESTRRDARYIRLFYSAMITFVKKHGAGLAAACYILLLKAIIFLKTAGASKNPPASNHKSPLWGITVAFSGDEGSIKEMCRIAGLAITGDSEQKEEIVILCEGFEYSFKRIIEAVQSTASDRKYYFIHGLGTSSAVGSNTKQEMGSVISSGQTVSATSQ